MPQNLMERSYLVSVKDALQLVLEFAMFVVALLALVVQLIAVIMACC
ncbi:putative holin-like toxin [Lactobacillus rossiae]|uniref:Putative holin-like toxin n=1 Tax=Furfurilactobacillus milii TaxID=2888272 RepID=A0A6N9I5E8_9LACO|nr:putative holin-like toxin [Furfurilactobacillus milii]